MSRNGSGTYTLPAGNPVVTSTTISSTWANNTMTDLATALTGSLASDGQTTATGNLKMGNNRITGLADGLAATDAATVGQLPSAALFLLKASNLSDVANATTARGNLTAAKSGANSDITSLTGLTTPLTVAQGGTGAATLTANNVLLGNGTSAPQVVAPSTAGNVLTSNGTTWTSSAPNLGKVLQVLSTAKTDTFTTTSAMPTFVDVTGLSAAITPASASNKVLVTVTGTYGIGNANFTLAVNLVRDSTSIAIGDARGSSTRCFAGTALGGTGGGGSFTVTFLDSPATTSATTYKVQLAVESGSTALIGGSFASGGAFNFSTPTTITLMEIAA
jgi:hypothetical protein